MILFTTVGYIFGIRCIVLVLGSTVLANCVKHIGVGCLCGPRAQFPVWASSNNSR